MIKNIFKHLKIVLKHKWVVFKLSIKAGIPVRGFLHDLSKFSPTEFLESCKYYNGTHSPITDCKKDIGYSKAWLHHKGRNKHHYEYWYDCSAPVKAPIIPYKYAVEMVCDTMAAGITYNGKNWTNSTQLEYFEKVKSKELEFINPQIADFLKKVYTEVSINGINKTITKKNLKKWYSECLKKYN